MIYDQVTLITIVGARQLHIDDIFVKRCRDIMIEIANKCIQCGLSGSIGIVDGCSKCGTIVRQKFEISQKVDYVGPVSAGIVFKLNGEGASRVIRELDDHSISNKYAITNVGNGIGHAGITEQIDEVFSGETTATFAPG